MKISEVSISRPILTSMAVLALVVFGAVSYRTIGVNLFPDVEFPVVTVTVVYEGADPETIESEVVDKIEEAVKTISGIKSLRSESIEGIGQVFVEFELDNDVDIVSQDIRDKVAAIRGELPPEIEAPIVEKFDINSAPILAIALSGPVSVRDLSTYADDVVKPQIESISGVGNVRLVGDRKREIRIWLRGDVLRAHNLSAQDVLDALARENIDLPGGRVETPGQEIIVKTKGKIERPEEFGDIIIANRHGTPLRVRDVAWVQDGMEDERSLARLNGQRAVSLLVRRQSGANALAVAEGVKKQLDTIQQQLPVDYRLTIAQDLSIFIDESISEAKTELLRGGILAVLVILLFLRSFRGSLVAAITIPTTIIATFSFMLAMDFTINMMSMLALTISVGMIIDDSIVVLENSYRHMEEGKTRMQAALAAMREIGFAVIATSLAVAAVFVPVAFMDGIVGKFFFEFGMTVTFAVVISTLIALSLSPMLCSRLLKVNTKHGRLYNAIEAVLARIESFYRVVLKLSLAHRFTVIALAGVAFAGAVFVSGFLGQEFVPEPDEGQFNVQVETPIGTSIDATSAVLAEIEHRLQQLPGVTYTFTTIGAGMEERVNVGTVLTKLVPKGERQLSQNRLMAMAREALSDLAHLKISVEIVPRVGGGGFRVAPLQYNIRGRNLDELVAISEKVIEKIKNEPGIVDVVSTHDTGKPQADLIIDRDKASDLGISVEDIGHAVHALIGGQKATTFEENGETCDVRVRLIETQRDRADAILDVPVRTKSGKLIELRNLVRVDRTTGPVQINREDRLRVVTVLGGLEKSKPLNSAMEDVAAIVDEIGLPPGVTAKFAGDAQMMEESFANMLFTLALAVVLIYMVLAAQFESLIHPFTVMLSLPLSIVGALGLLALTGRTLNIFSMIGMIMLMGLVTKNAILLIDYTNQLRRQGMNKTDAILRAGPVRLRPILMTTLSTIAGMIPVAIGLGAGAESRAPMGTAIVGGLLTSTVLTLVVIPVVYSIMDDLSAFARRLLLGKSKTEPEPAAPASKPYCPHPPELPVALDATVRIVPATRDTVTIQPGELKKYPPKSVEMDSSMK
jgi:HAE1 family hydrophobic/amphiphilic exporter-1